MKKGIWLALATYLLWGIFPVYWKMLKHVDAPQLLGHRIAWSFILLLAVIVLTRQVRTLRGLITRRVLLVYLAAALLIGVNWLIYVWAVNAGFIIETSLGYFINPLLTVLLGVVVLHERLRPWQWLPIGLAAAGVAYLTFIYGQLPWIALSLAVTFGIYGLVKKTAPLGSLFGLTLETGILFVPALVYLMYAEASGAGAFLHQGLRTDLLLIGAGLVTTIPLLLFASAAHRIPLTMIGVMQYIAPTMQFLIGVLVYKEAFTPGRALGFALVWAGLIAFWVENFLSQRKLALNPLPEVGAD
jgi:chloramphenicol-sensitive protein RarD